MAEASGRSGADDGMLIEAVAKALHQAWCPEPGHSYGKDDWDIAFDAVQCVRFVQDAKSDA